MFHFHTHHLPQLRQMIARNHRRVRFSTIILKAHRNAANLYKLAGCGSDWSRMMHKCKLAKAELRRDALALHSLLWVAGKTNVRPGASH